MQKEFVPLSPANRFVHTYGGGLDIVNGTSLSDEDLKFAALSYERIIVHDTYFSCYGPVQSRFSTIATRPELLQHDLLTVFLKKGIIVPAIRVGDALLDDWQSARHGVSPGANAALDKTEGAKILAFVDKTATAYANWPTGMASANITEFPRLLHRFLLSEELSPLRALAARDSIPGMPERVGELRAVKELFFNFEALVLDNLKRPNFRRADVERLVSDHLGPLLQYDRKTRRYDPRIYQSVRRLVKADRNRNLNILAADYLLDAVTTLYEVYHANQYETVGGLFANHDRSVIDAGAYEATLRLGNAGDLAAKKLPLVAGTFDVNLLSAKDIVEIRKSDEFREYTAQLKLLAPCTSSVSFDEANRDLIQHVGEVYLPYITSKFPKAGRMQTITKTVGTVGVGALPVIAMLHNTGPFSVVWLADHPMVVAVAALAGRIGSTFAGELSDQVLKHRRRRAIKRFKRNNYAALRAQP